jgi:hypothetical protein
MSGLLRAGVCCESGLLRAGLVASGACCERGCCDVLDDVPASAEPLLFGGEGRYLPAKSEETGMCHFVSNHGS